MSDSEKLTKAAGAEDPAAAEQPAPDEAIKVAPKGKAEYEVAKDEPDFKRGGYQKTEHEASEAKKQSLPEGAREKKGIEIGVGPLVSVQTAAETSSKSLLGLTGLGLGAKENKDDKEYEGFLRGKSSDLEMFEFSINPQTHKAKATLVKFEAEGDLYHAQVDVGGRLNALFGLAMPPVAKVPAAFAPMAARISDPTTHGSLLAPGSGSPNVFIGGLPAWRCGLDQHVCTTASGPPHGGGPVAVGAPTVLINGAPAARAGDWANESSGGPNVILMGCPTVFIGMTAGPPPLPKPPKEPKPEDLPSILFEGIGEFNVGYVEAKANVFGERDLSTGAEVAKAELDVEASALKVKLPLKIRLKIPFTASYISTGCNVDNSFLTIGAGVGVKKENGKVEVGGKIGAGVKSFGAKAGIDIGGA